MLLLYEIALVQSHLQSKVTRIALLFYHWREAQTLPIAPRWLRLSATVLRDIVDIPAPAYISLTSAAACGTPKCQPCHFPRLHLVLVIHESLARRACGVNTTSNTAHIEGGDLIFSFFLKLIIHLNLNRDREGTLKFLMAQLKHSHYCSTQTDHKREVFLVFPTSTLVMFSCCV